jgi:type IV secretory pathway TrbL component
MSDNESEGGSSSDVSDNTFRQAEEIMRKKNKKAKSIKKERRSAYTSPGPSNRSGAMKHSRSTAARRKGALLSRHLCARASTRRK